ncbi:glucose-1-phosphate adenylyltransferase subunit GlgD [Fonticella tunisiensis]|uniref:Glucose-1-phosphate adenylyltransferase n=1 Tax=Fonticella tunisiensis TaxID=1096341 RepID=A0A4R7KBF3_9CLOT|nr:glucose-1-phosphate adenylyltransferase subunit GlgD [Fonticella tunisiensis]TDT51370.1 glucose-1-phosphate adenylyltransferase [Fonticella tunisiensis]
MNEVLGIINDARYDYNLKEIGNYRSMASIPFGGRYRMIDFVLSNMINSGIQNVGILVQRNYRSIIGHLRSPKEWDLDRKRDGLFILPPGYDFGIPGALMGDLQVIHSNLDYIARCKQKEVIISGVNILCNINYSEALRFHMENRNDITVIYKDMGDDMRDLSMCTNLEVGDDGRILDMEVGPDESIGTAMSMNMYILSKKLLAKITQRCISRGKTDFVKNGIIENIGKLKIYGFKFDGYVAHVNSIQDYYRYSMELLNTDKWHEIFFKNGRIYTKAMDNGPAKYMKGSTVKNSLIANGCIIEGNVENSILFRKVKVHKGAQIKNSIVMQNCEIGEEAILENVILDKDSKITKGRHITGSDGFPIVIEKKTVI